jgi:hypothetical protein
MPVGCSPLREKKKQGKRPADPTARDLAVRAFQTLGFANSETLNAEKALLDFENYPVTPLSG